MDRRKFLISLFGTAAVAAAGPLPKIIEELPEKVFRAYLDALPRFDEVYGNGKDYAFAMIEYLDHPPFFKASVPEGYRPLREESDAIARNLRFQL